jgi:HlyD family secretion protein
MKPAAPTVERATVLIDTVKRGPMVIDVHGLGTLVPEDILWIQAEFDSQVSKILSQSGDEVKEDTVLLVLSNPQMEADANDYEWQAKQAEANYADLKVKLQSQTFDEQLQVATMQGDLKQTQITKEIEEKLLAEHLDSELNARLAIAKWEQSVSRFQMEKQKLDILKQSVDAQLESQHVLIEKLRATWMLKKKQVDELTIRAGIKGRMQEMTLQVGQRVKPGDVLAKVAQPWKLMARLQITETQAKDILLGQKASIDTRNGIVPGHVTRIDASIVNGTRTVDCKLDGPLPTGAVPDLSVDGTVEVMRLADVVYMQRPVMGQANSSVSLFKVDTDGKEATRTVVRLGHASVNNTEILEGLKPGDQVILSEMSGQDQNSRIRLN